jgi:hypothetical protein
MSDRLSKAAFVGLVTFVIAYILQFAISVAQMKPTSGPIFDPLLATIAPLILRLAGGVFAFIRSGS